MIAIPAIGRFVFITFRMNTISSNLLKVFSLVEMSVPTANAAVPLSVLLSSFLPRIGKQIEKDVATTILYQYCLIPVFFTINTALNLHLVYN